MDSKHLWTAPDGKTYKRPIYTVDELVTETGDKLYRITVSLALAESGEGFESQVVVFSMEKTQADYDNWLKEQGA